VFIAGRLCERFPETDPDIFCGMVLIDMQVTDRGYFEIKHSVFGKEGQHMIQKSNTCRDLGNPSPVQVENELNIGFGGFPMNRRNSCHLRVPAEDFVTR
jgi:hypothetical protein